MWCPNKSEGCVGGQRALDRNALFVLVIVIVLRSKVNFNAGPNVNEHMCYGDWDLIGRQTH